MRTPASSSYHIGTETGRTIRLSARALQTIYVSLVDGVYDLTDPRTLAEKDESTVIFDQVQEFDLDGESGLGLIEFFVMGGSHKYPDTWKANR